MAQIPTHIGKYEVVRRLGYGGMGTVYLGRHPDLGRLDAIKVLRDPMLDDELLERFFREARSAANLRHDNIVTVYDVGQHDHQPFMAMEYVDGMSLAEVIKQRLPLSLAQKLSYIEQICAGLHHAHGVGIVHRDIKPANLMVDRHDVIRILDFGIARVEGSGITTDGALMGTLSYMSPEQMLGRPVDFRSDIFSVGAVAYELLAYERAFPGSINDGLLQRLPNEDPAPLPELCPGLPAEVAEIVTRALAKKPSDRFGDLEEMRTAIRNVRRRLDPQLQAETVLAPSRQRSSRPKTSPPSASTAERRDLLERRARQIAVHRDAARAALARNDFESAIAACEDALTLDPDDGEASQLLAEIREAKERHDQESRARRDRERMTRQRIADAELRLAKGDVTSAGRLLQEVLAEEPHNAAALSLLARLGPGSPAPTVVRRPSAGRREGTDRRRVVAIASMAILILAGGLGGWFWMTAPGEPSEPAGGSTVTPSAASAPPRIEVPLPSPAPAAPPLDVAVTTPPPGPGNVEAVSREQLNRITAMYQKGDLAGALVQIDRVTPSGDTRIGQLAGAIAQAAYRSMDEAMAAATTQKAVELAPATFAAADQARRLADAARNRNDHVQAGRQALAAAASYGKAAAEARVAAAKPAVNVATLPPPSQPPTSAAPPTSTANVAAPAAAANAPASSVSTPSPSSESAAPSGVRPTANNAPVTAAAKPAAAPKGAETTAAAADPPPAAVDAGALMAPLNRFRFAYREKNMRALLEVFPVAPREMRQGWEKTFNDCRSTDLTYANVQPSPNAQDLTSAIVTARSTYTCQPKSRQPALDVVQTDVFQLRSVGGVWVIDDIGQMNQGRR